MDINIGTEYLIYENEKSNQLVAIDKSNQSIIKNFWKSYKGKANLPADTVNGYMFIPDAEQKSLKIDFSKELTFEIKHLKKFD
jgi:hypothetical protein